MPPTPWYQALYSREDLRENRPLDAAEFVVHLDQVRDGHVQGDYLAPDSYFSRMYLVSNLTDTYDRLERYVWVEDLLVNAELVRLGYARAVAYPPDTAYQAHFAALQAEAQAARRGGAHAAPTPAAGHALVQITGLRRNGATQPQRTRRVRRDHEPGDRGAGFDRLAPGQ